MDARKVVVFSFISFIYFFYYFMIKREEISLFVTLLMFIMCFVLITTILTHFWQLFKSFLILFFPSQRYSVHYVLLTYYHHINSFLGVFQVLSDTLFPIVKKLLLIIFCVLITTILTHFWELFNSFLILLLPFI